MLTVVREGNGKDDAEGVAWSGVRGLFARLSTCSTRVSTPLLVSNVESFLSPRHQLEPTPDGLSHALRPTLHAQMPSRSSCTELHRLGAHLCGRPDASRSVVVGSVHAPNVDGLERFRRQLRTKGMESASLSAASHSARVRQPVSQTYAYRAGGSRDGWRRVVYRVAGDQRRVVASGAVLMVVSEGNGKNEPEGVA